MAARGRGAGASSETALGERTQDAEGLLSVVRRNLRRNAQRVGKGVRKRGRAVRGTVLRAFGRGKKRGADAGAGAGAAAGADSDEDSGEDVLAADRAASARGTSGAARDADAGRRQSLTRTRRLSTTPGDRSSVRLGAERAGQREADHEEEEKDDLGSLRGLESLDHNDLELWLSNKDESTGDRYYVNARNGARSWVRPEAANDIVLNGESVAGLASKHKPENVMTAGRFNRHKSLELLDDDELEINDSMKHLRDSALNVDKLANSDVHSVNDLLKVVHMEHHAKTFQAEGVDLPALFFLRDDHLKDMGLNLGERIKMMRVIRLLRGIDVDLDDEEEEGEGEEGSARAPGARASAKAPKRVMHRELSFVRRFDKDALAGEHIDEGHEKVREEGEYSETESESDGAFYDDEPDSAESGDDKGNKHVRAKGNAHPSGQRTGNEDEPWSSDDDDDPDHHGEHHDRSDGEEHSDTADDRSSVDGQTRSEPSESTEENHFSQSEDEAGGENGQAKTKAGHSDSKRKGKDKSQHGEAESGSEADDDEAASDEESKSFPSADENESRQSANKESRRTQGKSSTAKDIDGGDDNDDDDDDALLAMTAKLTEGLDSANHRHYGESHTTTDDEEDDEAHDDDSDFSPKAGHSHKHADSLDDAGESESDAGGEERLGREERASSVDDELDTHPKSDSEVFHMSTGDNSESEDAGSDQEGVDKDTARKLDKLAMNAKGKKLASPPSLSSDSEDDDDLADKSDGYESGEEEDEDDPIQGQTVSGEPMSGTTGARGNESEPGPDESAEDAEAAAAAKAEAKAEMRRKSALVAATLERQLSGSSLPPGINRAASALGGDDDEVQDASGAASGSPSASQGKPSDDQRKQQRSLALEAAAAFGSLRSLKRQDSNQDDMSAVSSPSLAEAAATIAASRMVAKEVLIKEEESQFHHPTKAVGDFVPPLHAALGLDDDEDEESHAGIALEQIVLSEGEDTESEGEEEAPNAKAEALARMRGRSVALSDADAAAAAERALVDVPGTDRYRSSMEELSESDDLYEGEDRPSLRGKQDAAACDPGAPEEGGGSGLELASAAMRARAALAKRREAMEKALNGAGGDGDANDDLALGDHQAVQPSRAPKSIRPATFNGDPGPGAIGIGQVANGPDTLEAEFEDEFDDVVEVDDLPASKQDPRRLKGASAAPGQPTKERHEPSAMGSPAGTGESGHKGGDSGLDLGDEDEYSGLDSSLDSVYETEEDTGPARPDLRQRRGSLRKGLKRFDELSSSGHAHANKLDDSFDSDSELEEELEEVIKRHRLTRADSSDSGMDSIVSGDDECLRAEEERAAAKRPSSTEEQDRAERQRRRALLAGELEIG